MDEVERVFNLWRKQVTTSVKFQVTSSTIVIVPTFIPKVLLAFAGDAEGESWFRSLAKFVRLFWIRQTTQGHTFFSFHGCRISTMNSLALEMDFFTPFVVNGHLFFKPGATMCQLELLLLS